MPEVLGSETAEPEDSEPVVPVDSVRDVPGSDWLVPESDGPVPLSLVVPVGITVVIDVGAGRTIQPAVIAGKAIITARVKNKRRNGRQGAERLKSKIGLLTRINIGNPW